MTRKDAVVLASRAFALYLIAWGLSDLTYVPQSLLSLRHHSSVLFTNDYWWTYYSVALLFHVVRIAALFVTAGWLYRCGHRVEAFFLPSEESDTVGRNP
jgi:hypothetical protein